MQTLEPPSRAAQAFAAFMLVVPLGATLWAIDRGYDPNASAILVLAGIVPAFFAAERLFPHARVWNRSQGDALADVLYAFVISPLLGVILTLLLSLTFLQRVQPYRLSEAQGLWPHQWPLLAQALLVGLLTEFGQYVWHRLCHTWGPLWRFHAVHHGARRLYFMNAYRFHPVDSMVGYLCMYAPVFALGANQECVALFTVFDFVCGNLQHGNLALRLGPLNWLLSGPELHRWHHSKNIEDSNTNYGSTFIVWDVIFGTRKLPKDRVHSADDLGFDGVERFPQGLVGQLLSVFGGWNKRA